MNKIISCLDLTNNIMKVISIIFLVILLSYSSVSKQFGEKYESDSQSVDDDHLWSIGYNAKDNSSTMDKRKYFGPDMMLLKQGSSNDA